MAKMHDKKGAMMRLGDEVRHNLVNPPAAEQRDKPSDGTDDLCHISGAEDFY